MNKKELKTVLKPLIRECIKDVIFEEGILSSLISEVLSATSKTTHVSEKRLVEQKRKEEIRENNELEQKTKIKLEETRSMALIFLKVRNPLQKLDRLPRAKFPVL